MSPPPLPERSPGPMRLVLSSYPSPETATAAARGALERKLVACASVLAQRSQYWWRGRIESASESLVVFKTAPKSVGALFGYLRASHPYEVPEVVELDVPRVDPAYLGWLLETVDPSSMERAPPRLRRPGGRRARGARPPGRTRARRRRRSR